MTSRPSSSQRRAVRALDGEERVRAFGRLQGELYTSVNGVVQQAQRLREGNQPCSEYMADGRMLLVLLRDAIRISETCLLLVPESRAGSIRAALRQVHVVCPGVVDARDALEHCDDYILNIGRQQEVRPGPYAQRFARGHPPTVRVGDVVVDVDAAGTVAVALGSAVMAIPDDEIREGESVPAG